MSIQREIVQRLFESKDLHEAEFQAGGSRYYCAFGKYYKDGEQISREDYFRAKETGNSGSSPSSAPAHSQAPAPAKSAPEASSAPQLSSKVQDAFTELKASKAAVKAFTPVVSSLSSIDTEGTRSMKVYGGKYLAFPAKEGSSYEDMVKEFDNIPGMERSESPYEGTTNFTYKGKYTIHVDDTDHSMFTKLKGGPSVTMVLN